MIKLNFHKRKLSFSEQNYVILPEFWDSDLLFSGDENLRKNLIDLMTNLINSPGSITNERKKLNHELINIMGNPKALEQCYIFQRYKIAGVDIYPRLRFTILKKTIYFYDIINRH